MKEAGLADFEHELISLDAGFEKDTTDAVAAQLRDAGIKVKRTVLPGSTFWNDWAKYPFSSTNWNHRPLGTQVLGGHRTRSIAPGHLDRVKARAGDFKTTFGMRPGGSPTGAG